MVQNLSCSFVRKCSKVHRYRWRFTWGRKLWYVGGLRPASLHVAKQSDFCHGWPTSGDVLSTVTRQREREGKPAMEGEELENFRAPILEV